MSEQLQRIRQLQESLKEKMLRYLESPQIFATAVEGFHLVRRENGGAPAPRRGVSLTWERRQGKWAEKRAMLKI